MELVHRFFFEAAHYLPQVPVGHKCARLHGHSYECEIVVRGQVGPDGMVMDFADLSSASGAIVAVLDHCLLNEIVGLENPTSELLSCWIWGRLDISGLVAVTVSETGRSRCIYRGG